MKKTSISIVVDEEKLTAIKMYMGKKGADLEKEMAAQLEKLYEKYVPVGVRSFISERYSAEETGRKKSDGE